MVISRAKASAERVTEIFETPIDIDEGKAESKSGAVNGEALNFWMYLSAILEPKPRY